MDRKRAYPSNNTCLRCKYVHHVYAPKGAGLKYLSLIVCKLGYKPSKNCRRRSLVQTCTSCHVGVGGERGYNTLSKRGDLRLCPSCLAAYLSRGQYLYIETRIYYGNVTHDILYQGKQYRLDADQATQLILNGTVTDKQNEIEGLLVVAETEQEEQDRRKQNTSPRQTARLP